MLSFNVNLPKLIEAVDYHEFGFIENNIQLIDKNLKCEEVGFSSPIYVGIIYYKKYTKKQLKELLQTNKIELEE